MQRRDHDPHHNPVDETRDRGAHEALTEAQPAALSPGLSPPRWYGTDTPQTPSAPTTARPATHTPADLPASNPVTSNPIASDGAVSDGPAHATAMPEDTGGPARQSIDQHGTARPPHRPDNRTVNHPAGHPLGQRADGDNRHSADHSAHYMADPLADHNIDESAGGAGPSANAGRTAHPHAEDHVAEGVLGPDASVRDIARAARSAFVGKDLLQSGPGLWPFGRRARQRRARNRQAAEEARRRRARFLDTFDGGFDGGLDEVPTKPSSTSTPPPRATPETPAGARSFGPAGWRSVDRRTNAVVIACLAGVVLAVVLAVVWSGEPEPPAASEPPPAGPTSSSTPYSSTRPANTTTTGPAAVPPQPPIPTGGVAPVPPRSGAPIVDPRSVRLVEPPTGDPIPAELNRPDGAMRAWLSRVCPFEFTDEFGTAERRAKPAMTDAGWATLNPDNDTPRAERARASWDTTVAARESGRCAEPAATISSEAPRSDASAIVIGAITRVITTHAGGSAGQGHAPYVEELSEVRIVRRGIDGLWRVDLATAGG